MNLKVKQMLSVCIFGNLKSAGLKDCIERANKLTDRIILIDSDSNKNVQPRAAELGVLWADLDTLASVADSEWLLFVQPNERVNILSSKKLRSQLNDGRKSYSVYVKDKTIRSVLKEYQFIKNLGQLDRIGDLANITKVEARLSRIDNAEDCLRALIDNRPKLPFDAEEVIDSLRMETFFTEKETEAPQDPDEHDRRYLTGELYYGPAPGEELDELSTSFIGFRVFHQGYLDGFMECANRGLCSDNMYLSMLTYLNKNGDYQKSKDLLEMWIRNRVGPEIVSLYTVGGVIYAHLFQIDKAIDYFEKAAEISPDASVFTNIAKLCLIKGNRDKSIQFFRKAIEIEPDSPEEQFFLSVIDSQQWRPLTLSLCMIAKDEENTIGKALESIKNISDEIIVVDTGSADRTKEIVKEYGGIVIEHEWDDDFSAARNVALKEASCDYVLFLDADEFIDVRDSIGLALFKRILPPNGDVAYRINIVPDEDPEFLSVSQLDKLMGQLPIEQKVRLFPRDKMVYFTGAAFESVESSLYKKTIEVQKAQLFKIIHHKENPEMRDIRKIAAVDKAFTSLEWPGKAIEGGLFFLRFGDLKKAFNWFETVEKAEPRLMAKIATLYARQNLSDCAKKIVDNALEDSPDSPELRLALAELYFKEDRYNEVLEVLYPCVLSKNEDMQSDSMADAFYYYGTALLEMGHITEGIDQIARALEKNPLDVRYQLGGVHALAKADQWEQFLEVLQQIMILEDIDKEYDIHGFSDVAYVLLELVQHFVRLERLDEVRASQRTLEFLVRTKMVEQEEIEKMMNLINETTQIVLAQGA